MADEAVSASTETPSEDTQEEKKSNAFDELFKEWEAEEKEALEKRRAQLIAEGKDPDAEAEAEDDEEDGEESVLVDSEVTTDISFAFAEEEYVWNIPTGRYNHQGRQVSIEVKVVDPGDADLPLKFIMALQKDPVKAEEALWRSCVKSPKGLTAPGAVAKCTSVFRSTLTNRLRLLVGINRDFLESLMEMAGEVGQTGRQRTTKSSAKSQPPSDSDHGTLSESSTESGSTAATGGPTSADTSSEQKASQTPPSPSPRPLPTSPRKSTTPTPTSSASSTVELGSETHSS